MLDPIDLLMGLGVFKSFHLEEKATSALICRGFGNTPCDGFVIRNAHHKAALTA